MYILNKKRIIFLSLAICLPVGMFMFETANNNIKKDKIIETMATPVSNRTIIIDAGHRTGKMVELYQIMELVKRKLI